MTPSDKFITRCVCGVLSQTGLCEHISNEPPAPRAGERDTWKIGNLAIHGYKIYNEQGREVVTNIYRKEDAQQIVTEHNQHATLIEQRKRLLEIARDALQDRVEMNGSCLHDEYMVNLCSQCEIRQLLATIEQEGQA